MSESLMTLNENTQHSIKIGQLEVHSANVVLIKVLRLIPEKYDLSWSDGSTSEQCENLQDFLLKYYRDISAEEIKKAYDLNAARKFENHVESYGKWNQEFLGGLLTEYKKWRAKENQNRSYAASNPFDIKSKLYEDLWKLKYYGSEFNPSMFIDEKFIWLTKNRKEFNSEINKDKLEIYEAEELNTKKKFLLFNSKITPKEMAYFKIKREMIKEYLLTLLI